MAHLGDHLAGENTQVLFGEVGGQGAELQHRRDLPEAHLCLVFLQLFGNRRRRAAQEHAVLDQRVAGEVVFAHRVFACHHRLVAVQRRIARRQLVLSRRRDEPVEQAFDMRRGFLARDLVGFRDIGRHRPAELVGRAFIAVDLALVAIGLEVFLHRRDRAEGDDIGVFAVRMGGEFDGFGRALGRDPDRRVRRLIGPRPQVHVLEVIMLAVEFERPRF